jgi:HK97 family phage major capsid protein
VPKRRSSADIAAEMEVIRAELVKLDEAEGTDEEVEQNLTRANELLGELDELEVERGKAVQYEKRVEAVRSLSLTSGNRESGDGARPYGDKGPEFKQKTDPFDADPRHLGKQDVISRAMTVIEGEKYVPISEANKAYLDRLVHRSQEANDPEAQFDGSYVARRVLLTENPVYRSAFKKYCRFGNNAAFNAEESRAIAAFQDFEVARAANEGTTTAGGFGVPVMIDPTIIITSGAADAPILRICRTEPVTNNVWKGVSSAGMTWSYDAEASEVSDDAATLAQPSVTVYMPRGYIPYSIEVGMDYPGFASEMSKLLDQGYTDLLAKQTVVGVGGTTSPRGIFTALDANTNVEIVTTTDGSFGGVDVFKVWNALPERYRSRATWVMSVSVESAIRQFASAAGSSSSYFTVDLTADGLSKINGRPVVVTDYAPSYSAGVPGTTGAANILVAQRAGMSVEQVPLVVGSNQRPTGQRGMFAWARHGADSINDLGFRILENQ